MPNPNQVIFEECSEEAFLTFNDERYNLIQIHVHSPSEHAVRISSNIIGIKYVFTLRVDRNVADTGGSSE